MENLNDFKVCIAEELISRLNVNRILEKEAENELLSIIYSARKKMLLTEIINYLKS